MGRHDRLGRALALATAALLASCIYVVPSEVRDSDNRCHFDGDGTRGSTACGLCIAAKCQSVVDACCKSLFCRGDLTKVDQCASGSSSACASLEPSSESSSILGSETRSIGLCVRTSCGTECRRAL